MQFKIYTGEKATNCSVNVTYRGSFEASDLVDALRKIDVNTKHRYCKEWQFPHIQDNKTFEWITPDYIKPLHNSLPYCPFVCIGDPLIENVIWKHPNAEIEFFQKDS